MRNQGKFTQSDQRVICKP